MRSKLTLIIILISIILLVYVSLEGLKIGEFQILSISQLIEKNDDLNKKITEASKLTTTDYPDSIENLEETYENYLIQKQKYEDLAGKKGNVSNDIYETKQYDIGYLWRILGSYAGKRNVNLGIDVQENNIATSSYIINFTVSGKYINISQFITDIENDSDLYFRIYNFNMTGSGEIVTALFTVKNINIDPSTIK